MSEPTRSVTEPSPAMLRGFIVLRVVVVSTLLLSALLIQLTFSISLPLKPIYYLAAFAYTSSVAALLLLDRLRPEAHLAFQIIGDLVVITGLVYLSRGPDSGFTFLYLAAVSAGASLLGKRGGLITAGLAAVFYAVLVDLMAVGAIRTPEYGDFEPRVWSRAGLYTNVALNVAAFFATALLVATASERLREARADAERQKAEMAQLQALHTAVLASMSSGVVTTDLSGTVTYANPPAFELLHLRPSDVLERPLASIGLVDEKTWETIRASDDLQRFEGHRTLKGGHAYFGVSATPLRDDEGRKIGRILIFQNLTDLKKLEGEVRLKEKMAAVGELAAGIAHEIRNPLASISGSVQALRSSASPGTPEYRLMKIVVDESHRLSSILEDFLKYVKPRERAVESVDAAASLRDVMTLLEHSEELSQKHRLVVDIRPASAVLDADAGQLRQVFWNLSRNALAAMPSGGMLKVMTEAEEGRWTVAFSDEGRGMTGEERDRLFTPFAQGFPRGTGLGLAIVYRIVEEHGGSIRVDTASGTGTTIHLSFPMKTRKPRAVESPGVREVA